MIPRPGNELIIICGQDIHIKVISEFLPSPKELALKGETVKVTIALSKASVEFFKKEAKKYNTPYQKMIRRLLDEYTAHQS